MGTGYPEFNPVSVRIRGIKKGWIIRPESVVDPNPTESEGFAQIRIRNKSGFRSIYCCQYKIKIIQKNQRFNRWVQHLKGYKTSGTGTFFSIEKPFFWFTGSGKHMKAMRAENCCQNICEESK
jgi:hypothetical protein